MGSDLFPIAALSRRRRARDDFVSPSRGRESVSIDSRRLMRVSSLNRVLISEKKQIGECPEVGVIHSDFAKELARLLESKDVVFSNALIAITKERPDCDIGSKHEVEQNFELRVQSSNKVLNTFLTRSEPVRFCDLLCKRVRS